MPSWTRCPWNKHTYYIYYVHFTCIFWFHSTGHRMIFFFSNRRLTKHTYPSKPKSTQHTHRWTDRPTREELGRKSTTRKVEVIVRSNRATFVMLRCVFYQQIKGTYTDNNNNKITCFPALVCYIHIYVLYTVWAVSVQILCVFVLFPSLSLYLFCSCCGYVRSVFDSMSAGHTGRYRTEVTIYFLFFFFAVLCSIILSNGVQCRATCNGSRQFLLRDHSGDHRYGVVALDSV